MGDAFDDLLEELLGPEPDDYEDMDIDIVQLFEGDDEALDALVATLPIVNGRRVRSA